jgi:hypothetical protein
MSEAQKASLLQKYTETLAKLTDNQTKLMEEYEKTGRVNTTTFSNLISNYAKMTAAAFSAQGAENASTIQAYSRRLEQLDNNMSRFGRGQAADLGLAFKESAGKTRSYLGTDKKVNNPSQLASVLIADLRNLQSTNPKMIVPYVQTVEGSLGINMDDFLTGNENASGSQFANGQTQQIRSYLKSGVEADGAAADVESKISADQAEAAANLIRMTGTPKADKFLKDVLVIYKGVKAETGGAGDVSQLPPPPADATPEQRAEWVNKVSSGRLSLEADGRVHEKVSGAPDMMSYDDFAAYHGPGGMTRTQESMKPYLQETRDTILKEMDRITNSTDRSDLETKAHIMGSDPFKEYAKARGYSIADPTLAGQTFRKLMAERKLQMTRGSKDQNMIEDINKMTGVQEATPVGVLAATVRHGLRSAFNPELTNPSARITKGAQAPSEVAPEISEAPAETAKAKADIAEPIVQMGEGGFIYMVNGSQVFLIGRDPKEGETKATRENPIQLSPPDAVGVLKELGIAPLSPETTSPDEFEFGDSAPVVDEVVNEGKALAADAMSTAEEGEEAPVDAEVESDVAEAPPQEAAPVEQEPVTPEQRRQKRLSALDEARKQAMERVGSEQPEAATGGEGEDGEKKKTDPAAVVKSMLGSFKGGYERSGSEPLAIPGLDKQSPPAGAPPGNSVGPETPEDKLAPISRRRRFELLRGLEQ